MPLSVKEKNRRYLANPKHREENRARANKRRDELRKKISDYKHAHPCPCGEDHPAALDFHHVSGVKEFEIGRAHRNCYSWKRIEVEIAKCEVICRNCHAKKHWYKNFKRPAKELEEPN